MPLPSQLKISEQLAAMRQVLREWAEPRGGFCEIMQSQAKLWEHLLTAETEPRLLLICTGATLRLPNEPDCRREDRTFDVVIVRGSEGFKDTTGGGKYQPFTDSTEEIRDLLRRMVGISDEEELPSVRYRGWKPLPSIMPTPAANVFMNAVVLTVSTANDIPEVGDYVLAEVPTP